MSQSTPSQFARWFSAETLAQSIGIGLVLTIVARVAALGRGVLFARLMDRAELGVWAITNSTMQMLSIVLVFGVPAGLCRYVARYERHGQLRSFLAQSLGLTFGFCVGACLLGVVLCRSIADWLYQDTGQAVLTVLLCFGALALAALNLVQGVLQGLRVYRFNAALLVIQSLGFAGLAATLFVIWRPTALASATAFVIVSSVLTAIPAWMLWRHIQAGSTDGTSVVPGMRGQLLAYSIGTWGSGALFSLWGWLDRYMLLHFDTLDSTACLEQLGTYHIVENVTLPVQALGAGWSTQVLSHTVHLWESDRKDDAGQLVQLATKLTVLVLMFAAAGLIVLKQFIVVNVFGDVTAASGEILEFVLVVTVMLAAQCMLRCWVLCQERAWLTSIVWVFAVVVSVALNLLLVPVFHLKGAAITATASATASTLLLMWFTQRAGLRIPPGTWLAVMLPLALLLPAMLMLATLAVAVGLIARTDWVLSEAEKERLNLTLADLFARRTGWPRRATA